jgi:hypothetical protein
LLILREKKGVDANYGTMWHRKLSSSYAKNTQRRLSTAMHQMPGQARAE